MLHIYPTYPPLGRILQKCIASQTNEVLASVSIWPHLHKWCLWRFQLQDTSQNECHCWWRKAVPPIFWWFSRIALGLSTDGFAPFKRQKHTCWPLILFNYNLPQEIWFLIQHIICIGVIPGPRKPKDFNSFLWLLVEGLLKLSSGVQAFDVTTETMFALQASSFLYLVTCLWFQWLCAWRVITALFHAGCV